MLSFLPAEVRIVNACSYILRAPTKSASWSDRFPKLHIALAVQS